MYLVQGTWYSGGLGITPRPRRPRCGLAAANDWGGAWSWFSPWCGGGLTGAISDSKKKKKKKRTKEKEKWAPRVRAPAAS